MDNKTKNIQILECTLRDGSYAIDYQFTAEDSALIAAGLEQAGFDLIEIGHGLGLNASTSKGIAAAADEEYLEATASVLKRAKYGTFFIPGIGRMEDIELAAKHGMGFIRIGTNVNEVEQAEPFIKRAKELGMMVFSNLMKSYALPVSEFIEKAKLAAQYGADVIVVVDSAGGMLPDDVKKYVSGIKKEVGTKVGFHGHNNLHMAVANSLEAANAGADIVDSSLQGMGRSAGNAQTEVLVILLEKLGFSTEIDLYQTMDLGDKVIVPMMGRRIGIDSLTAIIGQAQFHSGFISVIHKIAKKYNIDPRELVVKVSERDKIKVTEEMAEEIAQKHKTSKRLPLLWNVNLDFRKIVKAFPKEDVEQIANNIALEMFSLAKKTNKQTIFTIAGSHNKNKKEASFPFIRQNAIYIIGNAEVANADQAIRIAKAIDGHVDYILIDSDRREGAFQDMECKVTEAVSVSKILSYKDCDAQVNATEAMVAQLLDGIKNKKIGVIGADPLVSKLILRLSDRGCEVVGLDRQVDMLIGISPFTPVIDQVNLQSLKTGGIVIDAGPGSVAAEAIDQLHRLGITMYRVDMRAGLSGEIINVLETHELKHKIMGKGKIAQVDVVAGGIIGRRGDIVIDSISMPTRVIGVADGKGQLLLDADAEVHSDNVKQVRLEIAKRRFA